MTGKKRIAACLLAACTAAVSVTGCVVSSVDDKDIHDTTEANQTAGESEEETLAIPEINTIEFAEKEALLVGADGTYTRRWVAQWEWISLQFSSVVSTLYVYGSNMLVWSFQFKEEIHPVDGWIFICDFSIYDGADTNHFPLGIAPSSVVYDFCFAWICDQENRCNSMCD